MNYVVLSSDCNINYAFLIPITIKTWERLGYKGIVMLVGDANEWISKIPEIYGFIQNLQSDGHIVIHINKLNGYSIWTTANIVRLYAGCLPLHNDDYVIIGDADLWVIDKEYINKRDINKPVNLWYANAFSQSSVLQFPMCHVGSTIKAWREIMQHGEGDISTAAASDMDSAIGKGNDSDLFFNEKYYAERLSRWGKYPSEVQFIDRIEIRPEYPAGRLDRSAWHTNDVDGYIDTHLLRDPIKNWHKIAHLMKYVLTDDGIRYVMEYTSGLKL